MTDRTALFDAIRPFAPDKRFEPEAVRMIDSLADYFGLARVATPPLKASLATGLDRCRYKLSAEVLIGGGSLKTGDIRCAFKSLLRYQIMRRLAA